jgi:hypothetical protein
MRNVGSLRDLVNGDLVVVAVPEDLECRDQQLGSSLLRPIACQRARCDGVRLVRVDFESTLSNG